MSFVSEDDFDLPEEQSPDPAHVGRRRPVPVTSKYSAQRKPTYSSRYEEESSGPVSVDDKLDFLKGRLKALEKKAESASPFGARASSDSDSERLAEIEAKLDFLKDKVKASDPTVHPKPIGVRAGVSPSENKRLDDIEAKLDFLKEKVKAGEVGSAPKPIGARASSGFEGSMSHIGAKVDLLEKTVNSMAAEKDGLSSISSRLSTLETDLKSPNGVAARLDFLRDKMKTLDAKVEAAKPKADPWD